MTPSIVRAAVVGASSLLGRELADQLNGSAGTMWELTLLDTEDSAGKMTAAGDEALIIQPLTTGSFAGAHIVFFAADGDLTREHWRHAIASGAAVVDLTGALTGEGGVSVRAPLLAEAGLQDARLDLSAEAVVAAHPVTLMLACIVARLRASEQTTDSLTATVLLPASEQGKAGVDELHAQTVALLSFQDPPREVYDAQVAYTLQAGFGPEARADLGRTQRRSQVELEALLGAERAESCVFQCVQAPVFHGCVASIFVKLPQSATATGIAANLAVPSLLGISDSAEQPPSNASLGEQEVMQATVRASRDGGMWMWLVADDLGLQARNAIACAGELLAIRPAVARVQ